MVASGFLAMTIDTAGSRATATYYYFTYLRTPGGEQFVLAGRSKIQFNEN